MSGLTLSVDATVAQWREQADELDGLGAQEAERCRLTASVLETAGVRSVRELRALKVPRQADDE